jgi:hypothetical protein
MSNAETDFRRWFVDSLAPLRNNGDAGFIFVMVAFPLLERYLRNKSGTAEGESLGTDFFDLLGEVLAVLSERTSAPSRVPESETDVGQKEQGANLGRSSAIWHFRAR